MADKKVTQLTALTSATSEDLFLIIDNPNGTPVSKKITVKNLFGTVPSNTAINGRTTLVGNTVLRCSNTVATSNVTCTARLKSNVHIVTLGANPGSNNASTAGKAPLQLWFSNTYLYIAVNATTIKRVALNTF